MTAEQIRLIRTSWLAIEPVSDEAAAMFYARLFELDPALRPMFDGVTMHEQGRKLMQMLTLMVRGLDRLDELKPAVDALGRRHGGYGVRDEQYATVREALLWTLAQQLGDRFTETVRDAWIEAYLVLTAFMQKAAAATAA